jgi:hypothetical protein
VNAARLKTCRWYTQTRRVQEDSRVYIRPRKPSPWPPFPRFKADSRVSIPPLQPSALPHESKPLKLNDPATHGDCDRLSAIVGS